MNEGIQVRKKASDDRVVALAGCPNVGKSTLFNAMTGLKQHTGNWAGKTVSVAQGKYEYKGKRYILVDLPGAYSVAAQSPEEKLAADFIGTGQADCTVVVVDAALLEDTLLPVLQMMEWTSNMIVCLNMTDEAERRGISVDRDALSRELGIPVLGVSAGKGVGIEELREQIRNLVDGFVVVHPRKPALPKKVQLEDWEQRNVDQLAKVYYDHTAAICEKTVTHSSQTHRHGFDRIALGKRTGPVVMAVLLLIIFWLTLQGANYPSRLLQMLFDLGREILKRSDWFLPAWLHSLLVDGVYQTVSCVVSVMLPPLIIFYPLFSILEDWGYLPRAAFLMDHPFQKCGSCGKHALTMAMGFGCNAVGVTGARIIESRRERLLAIVTNSMIPCNGRFPAMIVIIQLFFTDHTMLGACVLLALVLLGIGAVFLSSKVLGAILDQKNGCFILELPPYRRIVLGKIWKQSIFNQAGKILLRAVLVSAPAGVLIWLLQHTVVSGISVLDHIVLVLEPIGQFLGMNGVILTAFLLAFPANELLLPGILMLMGQGAVSDPARIQEVLVAGGWTSRTALCVLLFSLFHWPCGTTCLTIRKETGSVLWTGVAMILPLMFGCFLCSLINSI